MALTEIATLQSLIFVAILSLALPLTYGIFSLLFFDDHVPINLPWVGKDTHKPFSRIRASLAKCSSAQEWVLHGYAKYSKQGISYVMPGFLSKPEIVVPQSSMKWLLDLPDDVLSGHGVHEDMMVGKYTFTDDRVMKDPFHIPVLYRYLPRRVGTIINEVSEEVTCTIDELWGFDTSTWKDVNIYSHAMKVIGRATNRIIVGPSICRDQAYLDAVVNFTQMVIPIASFLSRLPHFLMPVIGFILGIPSKYFKGRATKFSIPVIEERLNEMAKKKRDPSYEWEAPNDYLTWHITQAYAENRTSELDSHLIACRLLSINFASIHTTTIVITNMLVDLLSSDPAYVESIREEIKRVYDDEGGVWTKSGLSKLIRTDSAIRESMRLSNFLVIGLTRKVVAEGGIENKTEGYSLPYGVNVSVDLHGIHHDPELYIRPDQYDPFRFSRPREEFEAQHAEAKSSANGLKMKNLSMVTTGGNFFAFGHGRHACPGRFFVAIELKLMIAYMLLNYDFEPLQKRPKNMWLGSTVLPPMSTSIKVKRKQISS